MSVVASAKAKLVGGSGVLAPLLTGVTVAYSAPLRDIPRELVYAGSVSGPVELRAMAGGARLRRSENVTLQVFVRVYEPGVDNTQTTDARAVAIGDVIANYIATNPTLGDLTDLKLAQVSGVDLDGWIDDDGAGSVLTIAVSLMSYLT